MTTVHICPVHVRMHVRPSCCDGVHTACNPHAQRPRLAPAGVWVWLRASHRLAAPRVPAGAFGGCRRAIDEYRSEHGITDTMFRIWETYPKRQSTGGAPHDYTGQAYQALLWFKGSDLTRSRPGESKS